MKTLTRVLLAAVLTLGLSAANADVYSLVPPDHDLDDLPHQKFYTWGVNTPWPNLEVPVEATLTFDDIRDWTWESNRLYIHLLDYAPLGVTEGTDNQGGGDNFAGQGIVLTVYYDLPPWPQDLTYTFTAAQLGVLAGYAADGRFALGIDPDCHFYNNGVKLRIATQTSEIPEPATAGLLAAGAAALALRRRRRT